MTSITFDLIAPAALMAKDKHFNSHAEWVRNLSAKMVAEGSLEKAWDGQVQGEAVPAYIESSRWIARCPFCGRAEAVDTKEKFIFCFGCNMEENEYRAVPVSFPDEKTINEITAVLLERPMKKMGGPTKYERILRMRPYIVILKDGRRFGLGRDWWHTQTVEDLRAEQDEYIAQWKAMQKGDV